MSLNTIMQHAPTNEGNMFHINSSDIGKKALERKKNAGVVTVDDARLIEEYCAERKASCNLSTGRMNKIIFSLLTWRRVVGPFRENTITDIFNGVEALNTLQAPNGKNIKQNTRHDVITIIKPFYSWMIDEGYSTLPEKKLRAIKRPPMDTMTKMASNILTSLEIEQIIRSCETSRDRALLMMLYEGGFRIGELGTLSWENVKFDDYGLIVNVNYKTTKPRYVRLIMAKPYLAAWKNDYPFKPEPGNLVFVTRQKTGLTYAAVVKQIQRIAMKAGITKHVPPHIFRHSRITHLIQSGVSESVIKLMMWGNITTDMFQTYAHLTGGDIDTAMFELNGIKKPDKKESRGLTPRQCSRCLAINGPTQGFCGTCGLPLTEEARASLQTATARVEDDPRFKMAYDAAMRALEVDPAAP